MVSERVLSFFCTLVILISQARAKTEYQYTYCFPLRDYAPSSTFHYRTNLKTLLSRFTSNTKIDYGFYNSSLGQYPDTVYATALCRGDLTPRTCHSCLNNSTSLLLKQCPNETEAFGVFDKCVIHYADRSIFGYDVLTYQYDFGIYLSDETNVKNWDQYNDVLIKLLSRLKVKAATGDSNPNQKFAAGNATVSRLESVYAVAQCQPDLTEDECSDCLVSAFSKISECCSNRSGGGVTKFSCNFRYENYRFYETTVGELTLLSPQESPPLVPFTNTDSSHAANCHGISNRTKGVIATVVSIVSFVGFMIFMYFYFIIRKQTEHFNSEAKVDIKIEQGGSSQFDFDIIRAATNDFSDANKLGQGGFGAVYKGTLFSEQEVAVKRLSSNSVQGDIEFMNEVQFMTKLQHLNLVRLLGFCIERKERLLVYEFLPNKSLDKFLFDPIKRAHLDWTTRYKIIEGIARGLLYLHEDSQQRIIHRDLKPSNILLDAVMNPKISDFGLAKLFVADQSQACASKIAGTFGYMPPEYVRHGRFSVKSDVFSFGVIILEIVSGQKSSEFRNKENPEHLLSFAWENWRRGTTSNIIDPSLNDAFKNEIVRCIHIGLLCVQERVVDRPTLASVVLMLDCYSVSLPAPLQPAFFMNDKFSSRHPISESGEQKSNYDKVSANDVSISSLCPR